MECKISKWMKFRKMGASDSGKTEIWDIKNKQSHKVLGMISWDAGWRQYVFRPADFTYFSRGCLRDIADFIEELMEKRKE